MKNIVLVVAACMVGTMGGAQPMGQRPGHDAGLGQHTQSANPKQTLRQRCDIMKNELDLTDKQYKKVYKIYLRRERNAQAAAAPSVGDAPGGFGGMRGGGMPGGMMSGGGMPMPRGGGQPGGQMGMQPGGQVVRQRPDDVFLMEMDRAASSFDESRKEIAAHAKKMKKILTAEQFSKWQRMENEHRRKVRPQGAAMPKRQ